MTRPLPEMDPRQEPGLPDAEHPDPYIFMKPTPRGPADGPLFRPRAREGVGGLTIGLLVAGLVVGLYALGQWWWVKAHQASRAERVASQPPVPLPVPVKMPDPPPAEGVRRCTNAVGDVSYSDTPCPAGTQEQMVDTTGGLELQDGPGGVTLYRCRGAGFFWSVVHCQHRGAEVTATYTVPANLPLADQILFAQNREALSRPGRTVAPRAVHMGPPPPPSAARQKAEECAQYDREIAALDSYARHALSPGEQDRVRGERQALRDRQFRLHCGR